MKQLTLRQTGMILALSMVSVKFLVFPALTFRFAGINSYISTLISFILDAIFIGMVAFVLFKFPNKTFKEIMAETYGIIVTKICYFVIFAYMSLKTLLIMKEAHTYFQDTLFENLTMTMFIIPIIVSSMYIASKNLKTIGRTVELFFPLIAFGIILMMVIPITKVDIFGILPFMEQGFKPVADSIGKTAFAYGDQMVLLLLIGNIKYDKEKPSKIFWYIGLTAALVIVMNIVFICLFGDTAIDQQLAVSEIPLHSTNPTTMGRLDWLTIMIWIITLLIQSGVFMFFAVEAFSTFSGLGKGWSVGIVGTIITIGLILLSLKLAQLIDLVINPIFVYIIIAVQVIIPIMMFLAALIKKKKRRAYEKAEENI